MKANTEGRLIGIQHRRKKTAKGEARPTVFFIHNPDGTTTRLLAEDDLAELDWVHGKYPVAWRAATLGENLKDWQKHHIRFRKPADNETLETMLLVWPEESLDIEVKSAGRKNERKTLVGIPTEVAERFDGLSSNDQIISIFGGSGGNLMQALAIRGEKLGASVYLTAAKHLKAERDVEHNNKEDDAELLVDMFTRNRELFHEILPTDIETWEVLNAWRMTEAAMAIRLRTIQQFEARALHGVYVSDKYVGAKLAEEVLTFKMGDRTVSEVMEAEKLMQKELEASIEAHPLFEYLFGDIKGCGPRLFGKLLSAVVDVRRFPRKGYGAFLRFTGYAIDTVGGKATIQRFRRGGGMPGNPEIKQAIWLLVDMQFSRQGEETHWGRRFKAIKESVRAKHPHPIVECQSEYKLKVGEYTYDSTTRTCTFEIARGKTASIKGDITGDGAPTLVADPEMLELHEGKYSYKNGLYSLEMPDGTTVHRLGKSKYSKMHVHKIAQWKLGTEFMLYVFGRWWQYIDEQTALRDAEPEAKAA